MDVNYGVYLDSETKRIIDYLSAHGADDGEKDAVISAFTEMLSENVVNKNDLRDYEQMMYFNSLKYVDTRIAGVLNDLNASYEDNELALGLCTREKELLEVFAVRKWQLPSLKNAELDKCMNVLRNRAAATSIIDRIIIRNGKLNELIAKAEQELSIATCDKALAEVKELANDIASCKSMKTAVPNINNLNTEATKNRIIEIRRVSEQKEKLEKDIFDVDLQIHSIVSLTNTTQKQWLDVISLCYKQKELLSSCRSRGWKLPLIRYENPEAMINKYKHYIDMDNLDKKIMANQGKISNKKVREAIYADCAHQNANIKICTENGWEIPELAVSHPLDIVDNARREEKAKERINNLRKLKAKLIVGLIICIAVVVVGFKIYTRDKIHLPFNNEQVVGVDRDEIKKELKDSGFNVDAIEWIEDSEGDYSENEVTKMLVGDKREFNKWQYWKRDTRIVISYYVYKIPIMESSKDLKGQNYTKVEDALKHRGFTNIVHPESIENTGWQKPGDIVVVSVDGKEEFGKDAIFRPDSRIVIKLSSGNRVNATSIVENWQIQNYEELKNSLQNMGISNVEIVSKPTIKRDDVDKIAAICIDDSIFESGECYINKEAEVKIEYYVFKTICIDGTKKSFIGRDYKDVRTELENKGFINVKFLRTNNLNPINSLINTEGSVRRLFVDNTEDYDETKIFDCDVPIVVEVYTYKKEGCEDITEIAR